MTPEETQAIAKRAQRMLKADAEERWAHTQVLAKVLGTNLGGLR